MKHEPIMLPGTAAVQTDPGGAGYTKDGRLAPINGTNLDLNATEEDKVLVVLSGVVPLAGAETVLISTRNSQGALVPVYTAAGTQAQLNATTSSVMLEGGFIYAFTKSVTVGSSGVDVYLKPRR